MADDGSGVNKVMSGSVRWGVSRGDSWKPRYKHADFPRWTLRDEKKNSVYPMRRCSLDAFLRIFCVLADGSILYWKPGRPVLELSSSAPPRVLTGRKNLLPLICCPDITTKQTVQAYWNNHLYTTIYAGLSGWVGFSSGLMSGRVHGCKSLTIKTPQTCGPIFLWEIT